MEILGYNLMRATSQDGPRELVHFMPAEYPGKMWGTVYQFNDTAVQPGVKYLYWLDVQTKDGFVTTLGPVNATVWLYTYLPALQH